MKNVATREVSGPVGQCFTLIASGVILPAVCFFFLTVFSPQVDLMHSCYLIVLSVLPVNSDLSPSPESDQEAALPPIDTSLDDCKVVELLLGNKN